MSMNRMEASERDPLLHFDTPADTVINGPASLSSSNEFGDDYVEITQGRWSSRRTPRSKSLPFMSDHGTFLADRDFIPNHSEVPPLDNPVTVSLHRCKQKVLQPYLRLLSLLGWRPLISEQTEPACWKKAINIGHLVFVICLILVAYIIQYAACFRRDRAISLKAFVPFIPLRPPENATTGEPVSLVDCQHHLISQYIIPDLLHSAAYIYSFFMLRISHSEELQTLMETVFLQSSTSHSGYLSQKRLIRGLRWLLVLGIFWIVLSMVSLMLDIIAQAEDINFTWMHPRSKTAGIMLTIIMTMGFVALDIVYVAVVINYSVQCSLLIFYIRGIQEKVRERSINLDGAMKSISETQKYVKILNENTSSAVSLVIFNFATMVVLGMIGFFDPKNNEFSTFMYVSTGVDISSWLLILATPLIQAARLSETCNSLKKLGHELRVRPFGYQDMSQLDLDSFLLYTSGLSMRAKIFRIPVRSYHIMFVTVLICFIILLLFQTGSLSIWL